jgi:hypothetical protein
VGGKAKFTAIRVPRQCPLALLVKVVWRRLKPKLVYIIFKNLVRTSKRTSHFTIKKIDWVTLF